MSNLNMDNLELLSNEELRLRLVQYGFQNLPVTSTTRKVLIKKLRTYMDNEKSKLRRETSYATRYSSGEESDDARGNGRKNRATVSAIPQANSTLKTNMPPPNSRIIKGRSISNANNNQLKSLSPPSRSSVYISPVIINDSEEETDYSSRIDKSSVGFGTSHLDRPARPIQGLLPSNDSPGSLYKKINYSPSTPTNHSTSQFLNKSNNSNGSATSTLESPYVSEYTKRLLQFRGETVNNENTNSNNNHILRNRSTNQRPSNHQNSTYEFNEDDIVTHAAPDPEPPHIPLRVALGNLMNKLDENYGFKQTLIPFILVFLFILFLLLVAFMYMTISPDITNTLNSIDTKYSLCEAQQEEREHCIEQLDVNSALELLKITAKELQRRVEVNKCQDSSVSFIMTADDVLKHAIEQSDAPAVWQLMRDLHNMEYLIDKNPQWHIDHVDLKGNKIDLEDVIKKRSTKTNCFAILKPKLPLKCLIYNKLQTFFIIVGGIGIIAILTYLIKYFIQYVVEFKQKRTEKVNNLINEITNAVMEQAAKAQTNSAENALVVVNHLRDSLIPPLERKQLEWAWVEAIKFLENNESRIQFEVGNRGGEDCKMMRWMDMVQVGSSSPSRPQDKKWQSPAFDKTNKIKDPPTPCLKVRQMFDKYEVNDPNLKNVVQNAILEKVGPSCKIYDIQFDRTTCCVYVRCATEADAGVVHDEINGWWFDNRLVSIKFLRLERYVSRFPKSLAGPKWLKPSNKNNSSMSQHNEEKSRIENDDDIGEDDDDV